MCDFCPYLGYAMLNISQNRVAALKQRKTFEVMACIHPAYRVTEQDTDFLLVCIWPCDLPVGEQTNTKKISQQGSINHHAIIVAYLVCHVSQRTNLREEGRRQKWPQTEQTQCLLKLNNSWLAELSWPWKTPNVGLLKPGTAHLGQRGDVGTDGYKPT